ncbi:23779_t:CDS:2, partial [Cetraspora pellucida]
MINLEDELEQKVTTELPTGMFSEDMLILQHWYLDTLVKNASVFLEPAIVAGLNRQLNVSEHIAQVDFSPLENIREKHVFSKPVQHEMICRHQWEREFGMIKKTLNLAIITNRTGELYKIHENFTKEIEFELVKENDHTKHNNLEKFAYTI